MTIIEKTLIKGQIDNNTYHIEINDDDDKTLIEVHLKNIFDNLLNLDGGQVE